MKFTLFICGIAVALFLLFGLEKETRVKTSLATANNLTTDKNTNPPNIKKRSIDIPEYHKTKNEATISSTSTQPAQNIPHANADESESKTISQAAVVFSAFENYESKRALQNRGLIPPTISNEIYLEVANKLSDFKPGDVYRLEALSLGLQHEIKVERVKIRENGISTMYGSTEINGERYAALFTSSENAIYGEIEHPDGTYLIEGTGKHIWMAKRKDMAKNVIPDASPELQEALKERTKQRATKEQEKHEMI